MTRQDRKVDQPPWKRGLLKLYSVIYKLITGYKPGDLRELEFQRETQTIQQFVGSPQFDEQIITRQDTSYPKFSIIVLSYNQALFLERTILSILNQNYPHMEIIILDGGSDDDSVDIIQKYEPYLTYWASKEDKGQSSAINEGFALATGDYVMWQNSDDLYMPNFLHDAAASLRKYPDSMMLIANAYLIDEHDRVYHKLQFAPFSFEGLLKYGWNLTSQATFVKRTVVEKVGKLREDIHVVFDWEWFLRVGVFVEESPIVQQKRIGGCYRIHSASKFSQYGIEDRLPAIYATMEAYGLQPRWDKPRHHQPGWLVWLVDARIWQFLLYSSLTSIVRPLLIRQLEKRNRFLEGFEWR